MRLAQLENDVMVRRPFWNSLFVIRVNGQLVYFDEACGVVSLVSDDSSAYSRNDFTREINQPSSWRAGARKIINQWIKQNQDLELTNAEEQKMSYEKTKVIVIESTNSQVAEFETEELALEYIAERLEKSPRSKFNMFKPYQSVEPKRVDLAELIKPTVVQET